MDFMFVLFSTLRISTPLVLAANGGLFCEKSGVTNMSLEGTMLLGAFVSALATYITGSPLIGVLAALLTGLIVAAVLALAIVVIGANQIVIGIAINIFAAGFTTFMLQVLFQMQGQSPIVEQLPQIEVPYTGGQRINPLVIVALAVAAITYIVLNKTRFGLHISAVGEHPLAADTVGIKVNKTRFLAVLISGALAGIAGATLAIGDGNTFVRDMTAGRGFMALAAIIFGRFTPIGTLLACLLFGFTQSLEITLMGVSVFGQTIPSAFINMIPYVLTIIVLAGFVGQSRIPSASGKPYRKI